MNPESLTPNSPLVQSLAAPTSAVIDPVSSAPVTALHKLLGTELSQKLQTQLRRQKIYRFDGKTHYGTFIPNLTGGRRWQAQKMSNRRNDFSNVGGGLMEPSPPKTPAEKYELPSSRFLKNFCQKMQSHDPSDEDPFYGSRYLNPTFDPENAKQLHQEFYGQKVYEKTVLKPRREAEEVRAQQLKIEKEPPATAVAAVSNIAKPATLAPPKERTEPPKQMEFMEQVRRDMENTKRRNELNKKQEFEKQQRLQEAHRKRILESRQAASKNVTLPSEVGENHRVSQSPARMKKERLVELFKASIAGKPRKTNFRSEWKKTTKNTKRLFALAMMSRNVNLIGKCLDSRFPLLTLTSTTRKKNNHTTTSTPNNSNVNNNTSSSSSSKLIVKPQPLPKLSNPITNSKPIKNAAPEVSVKKLVEKPKGKESKASSRPPGTAKRKMSNSAPVRVKKQKIDDTMMQRIVDGSVEAIPEIPLAEQINVGAPRWHHFAYSQHQKFSAVNFPLPWAGVLDIDTQSTHPDLVANKMARLEKAKLRLPPIPKKSATVKPKPPPPPPPPPVIKEVPRIEEADIQVVVDEPDPPPVARRITVKQPKATPISTSTPSKRKEPEVTVEPTHKKNPSLDLESATTSRDASPKRPHRTLAEFAAHRKRAAQEQSENPPKRLKSDDNEQKLINNEATDKPKENDVDIDAIKAAVKDILIPDAHKAMLGRKLDLILLYPCNLGLLGNDKAQLIRSVLQYCIGMLIRMRSLYAVQLLLPNQGELMEQWKKLADLWKSLDSQLLSKEVDDIRALSLHIEYVVRQLVAQVYLQHHMKETAGSTKEALEQVDSTLTTAVKTFYDYFYKAIEQQTRAKECHNLAERLLDRRRFRSHFPDTYAKSENDEIIASWNESVTVEQAVNFAWVFLSEFARRENLSGFPATLPDA